jgi:hypothetical protein
MIKGGGDETDAARVANPCHRSPTNLRHRSTCDVRDRSASNFVDRSPPNVVDHEALYLTGVG